MILSFQMFVSNQTHDYSGKDIELLNSSVTGISKKSLK